MNLMHSCRKAAELMSQRLDEPLGWLDGLRLRMHLSMCSNCSKVDEQLAQSNTLTGELFGSGAVLDGDDDSPRAPAKPG